MLLPSSGPTLSGFEKGSTSMTVMLFRQQQRVQPLLSFLFAAGMLNFGEHNRANLRALRPK